MHDTYVKFIWSFVPLTHPSVECYGMTFPHFTNKNQGLYCSCCCSVNFNSLVLWFWSKLSLRFLCLYVCVIVGYFLHFNQVFSSAIHCGPIASYSWWCNIFDKLTNCLNPTCQKSKHKHLIFLLNRCFCLPNNNTSSTLRKQM